MTRRKRRRRRFGRLVLLLALGIASVLAWRWLQSAGWVSPESARMHVEERTAPEAAQPQPGEEDFSTSEREALQDILKRKGAGTD